MKKYQDDLFELVMGMTRGEKLFFRNYLKNTASENLSHYVKLFDLISSSKDPQEEKIKKKLNVKSYSKTKWYLYESIMECLRLYNKNSTDDLINLYNLILNSLILKNKALTRQSSGMLEKAKKIAGAAEWYPALVEIAMFNLSLIKDPVIQLESLRKLASGRMKNAFEAEEKSKNDLQYLELSVQVLHFIRTRGEYLRKQKELEKLKFVMDDPLLKDEKEALTSRSKLLFFNLNAILSGLKGDFSMAYMYSSQHAALSNAKPESEEKRIGNIHNTAHYAICTRKWAEAKQWITRLKNIKYPSRDFYYMQFQHSLSLELFLHNKKGDFEKALMLVKQKEAELKKNSGKMDITFLIEIYLNISESWFLSGDYRKSFEVINYIFLSKKFKPRDETMVLARLFMMVLLYEMEDYESLSYAQDALYRYLSYKKRLYDFEKAMILFMRKIIKDGKEKESLFRELHQQLTELNKNPLDTYVISINFDYITWAESKIRKMKFADMLKEKSFATAG